MAGQNWVTKAFCIVFAAYFAPIHAFLRPAVGPQAINVIGSLHCEGKPQSKDVNAIITLYEYRPILADMMITQTVPDNKGDFNISVRYGTFFEIDPYVTIEFSCKCNRILKYFVPRLYITYDDPPKYDLGRMDMEDYCWN